MRGLLRLGRCCVYWSTGRWKAKQSPSARSKPHTGLDRAAFDYKSSTPQHWIKEQLNVWGAIAGEAVIVANSQTRPQQ
jgi:hypothetical protein